MNDADRRTDRRRTTQARRTSALRTSARAKPPRLRTGTAAPRVQPHAARRRRVARPGAYRAAAQARLRRFRRGTALAVALTGFLLLIFGIPDTELAQAEGVEAAAAAGGGVAAAQQPSATEPPAAQPQAGLTDTVPVETARAVAEATATIRELAIGFMGLLPKILIAVAVLVAAWLITRLIRPSLRRALAQWERADATSALAGTAIWLLALGVALSVLAGDVRALVGSLGLFGLALSWALQAPIESFTAWLLNSFRSYYRVGDRIAVGDAFGDVYRIDFLTTTIWEAGGPDKPVHGAQPTGALTTFPNSELLRSTIVNYTRDFPYVWDEVVVGVANESDLEYAMRVVADTARCVLGEAMESPIDTYRELLTAARLAFDIADEPQVYVSQAEAWTDVTVRYLVPARERRRWSSALILAISQELARAEHAGRIITGYPVTRLMVGGDAEVASD